ncbi:MAG: R2-like ligand-binding oxidase [Thermoanaerobaculia bacterium]
MRELQTTSLRGLDRTSLPFRLFEKAKRFGIWNPADIDFAQDRGDWQTLASDERDLLLRLTSMFQAGEESVTLDLLPLIQTIAEQGRIEEEMFLTSFLWEEAKHVDLFRRFLDEVTGERRDLAGYHSPSYREIVYEALPEAMGRLHLDRSAQAIARAAVTYNMIVEGVLAETGYQGYLTILEQRRILPGICAGVRLLRQDESRHIAYGVHLLSRLVAAGGPEVWRAVEEQMEALLPPALGVVQEMFSPYDPIPFGVDPEQFLGFAMTQFQYRFSRIERAGREGLAESDLDMDEGTPLP